MGIRQEGTAAMPASSSTLVAYAITAVVLSINLVFLWGFSGYVRTKTKLVVNHEDAALTGAVLADEDPPAVARVLRAHANAQAVIYPFLLLGLTYVLLGGEDVWVKVVFGLFAVARIVHSAMYLSARQPWRTASFALSLACLVALIIAVGLKAAA
jgi:uncharacterized membrane protein YecN with MAPEG domain